MLCTIGLQISAYPAWLQTFHIKTTLPSQKVITLILFISLLHTQYTCIPVEVSQQDGSQQWSKSINGQCIAIYLLSLLLLWLPVYIASGPILLLKLTTVVASVLLLSSLDFMITIPAQELQNISVYQQISSPSLKLEESLSATIKYFILSALASSIIIMSISLIYSITGTTSYDSLLMYNEMTENTDSSIKLMYNQQIIGLLLKQGAAPVHGWAPDLYSSQENTKAIWLILFTKFTQLLFICTLPLISYDQFIAFGLWSAIIGSIGLSYQFNFYRFIAYSSIANLGYILQCIDTMDIQLIVTIIYMQSTSVLQAQSQKHKAYSYIIVICLLSLAGCPPLPGFYGKFLVIYKFIELDNLYIAFILILTSFISTCSYLRVIVQVQQRIPSTQQQCETFSTGYYSTSLLSIIQVNLTQYCNMLPQYQYQ